MSIIRTTIQLDKKSDFPSGAHLLISQGLVQQLQLPVHTLVTLRLGQKAAQCRTRTFSSNAPILRIRHDIGEQLVIPDGVQLTVKSEPSTNELLLGPVFGVLITKLLKTPEGIFGSASSFCKEIVQSAKEKGLLAYIFTLQDVDQDNQKVNGWTLQEGKWVQSLLPYPDTVYNRLANRKEEKAQEMVELFSKLKERKVPLFNEHFLNKWQVHQALSTVAGAEPFLPPTYLFKGFATIKSAIEQFPSVYLKPTNGSLGKGIYKITKVGNHFTSQYSTMSGSVQKSFQTLSDLYKSISPRLSKNYLVQRGLNLIKINGNPLDFRSLVQKDRTGKWAVTSIVGRSGADQSIVSNLARGGTIMPVSKALALASPWHTESRPTTAYLRSVSIKLAQSLEESLPGHFAELGIDLAVDTSGKVWLLEINAKPSKNDDQVLSEQKTRPSVKKLLDYTLYLNDMVPTPKASSVSLIQYKKKMKRKKR